MNNELKQMIDRDISYCNEVWKEYAHDKEKMEELFHNLLFRYLDKVDFLADEMVVVSAYEENIELVDTYRKNVKILIERLMNFRDNGYQNEGLAEYCIDQDKKRGTDQDLLFLSFNQARLDISNMTEININERNEILRKIDAIEEVMQMKLSRKKKWEILRPYVLWVSGKELEVAMKIFPLLLKIEEK